MSWFSANYEKVLLGSGAVIAVGVAYFGWTQLGALDDDFGSALKGGGSNATVVQGADLPAKATQSLKLDHSVKQPQYEGRPVDLFTGVPLFVRRNDPSRAIDIVKGPEVHAGIPNEFWLKYRIDPGFADSPQRDEDGDGFTNQEEFTAKTDPTNGKEHPPLISKLRYVRDESLVWRLTPGFGDQQGRFPFTYEDNQRRKNRATPAEPVGAGQLFFAAEPMKGRFKMLGHVVEKQLNEAINVEVELTYVEIEDQKPNKLGTKYKIPAPLPRGQMGKYTYYDRSAVLSLEALGVAGKEFFVEENTVFSLPNGGAAKEYKLLEVTPDAIVVEYPGQGGNRQTTRIGKGSMPQL